jgi:hypothetical protein
MNMRFLLLLFGLFSAFVVQAQPLFQTIRGRIIDKDSQAPLIGATVTVLNTDPLKGAVSDLTGDFRIENVALGRHNLVVSYIGYEDVYINQLLVGSGKEVVLHIEMQEAVQQLQTVVVQASRYSKDQPINDMAAVSARSFSVEETSRYAASFNDPARMAQSYAGVSTANDMNNEIVIRGNSARGVLWRVEGLEIPNPNHFAAGEGSTGGGISILSNATLANSDFFTGAFPAEYGNALSGVFDLRLRRGNNEKREYSFQAGFLGLQAAVEGPFTKKHTASYLANYRYFNLGFLNEIGFQIGGATITPSYHDATFNINMPTKRAGRFSIFGIGGISEGGIAAKKDSLRWEYASDRQEQVVQRRMGVLGMTYTYLLKNNRTYFKLSAAYAAEDDVVRMDSLDNSYQPLMLYRDNFTNSSIRAAVQANHKFSARHVLRTGVNYDQIWFRTAASIPDPSAGGFKEQFERLESDMVQSYTQWQWRPVPALEINTGLHHTSFILNNNHVLEPRFGIRWQLRPGMALAYGTGIHSRLEPISLYANNMEIPLPSPEFIFENGNSFLFSPRSTLRLTQSFHNVAAFDWSFAPDFRMKAEIYYQHLFNVPVRDDILSILSTANYNGFSRDFDKAQLINSGKGRNYGLELTVEKFFSRDYYFLVTTSLFESQYRALDMVWRNTRFNGNYILNVVGGKEFKIGENKEHILGINGKVVWAGGKRVTPIDLASSLMQNREVLLTDQAFENRLPDFFRTDVGLSYRWNQPKYALIFTFDVQNVFNRRNVEKRYFDPYAGKVREVYQMGWVPVFNARVEF